jgi:hypothetical protein
VKLLQRSFRASRWLQLSETSSFLKPNLKLGLKTEATPEATLEATTLTAPNNNMTVVATRLLTVEFTIEVEMV